MKKANKKTGQGNAPVVTETKLTVAASREQLDSIFQPGANGYVDVHASKVQWTGQDIADYCVESLAEGAGAYQGAMRRSILVISAAIESDPGVKEGIKAGLEGRWEKQTIAGMMSVAGMLPRFRSLGVDLTAVGDIQGLRDISKTLKDAGDDKRKTGAIVKRLNKGESPRKIKSDLAPVVEEDEDDKGGSDASICETRKIELLKLAKQVKADCGDDAFALKAFALKVLKALGVSLDEPTQEESND
jgi:hypothetical protein